MSTFRDLPQGLIDTTTKLLEKFRKQDAEKAKEEDNEMLKKKAAVDAHSGDPQLGEGCGVCSSEKEHKKVTKIEENYASPEPASAVGFREGPETPKSASVLHDVTFNGVDREECYRVLVIYPNQRSEIVPSTDHPGASSIEQLSGLVSGIVDPDNVIGSAIADASALPSQEPRYRGNDKE